MGILDGKREIGNWTLDLSDLEWGREALKRKNLQTYGFFHMFIDSRPPQHMEKNQLIFCF